jgi:asparagine synthase (glutamine-hydrolysing)
MPGLTVIIGSGQKERNQTDMNRMVASLKHESFYNSGTYLNESLGLYVGWALHPGSYSDCLPLHSDDGRYLLFFYGEHLSDGNNGEPWNSRDCGSALGVLRLIEAHGLEGLQKLNGWFHGVLADIQAREVTLFNDRYGMQRFHFAQFGDTALFASEAKALLAVRPNLRKLDSRGVAEFLSCGCVLENRTLFAGIHTLPGGTVRTFKNGAPEKDSRYFSRQTWEAQSSLPHAEFYAAVREELPRAVRRCLRSRLPLGVSLTGGFDTRLIMACLAAAATTLPCYTFGGMYRECFDVRIARDVARLCGCSHRVLELGRAFLDSFPSLAERTVYLSDGALGATNAYELYLNRLARQIAAVRLTGSYGSEVMRGSRAFKAEMPTPGLIQPDLAPSLAAAINTFSAASPGHPVSFSVFKQAPWFYSNRLAVEQSQVVVRTPFMDNDFVGLFYRCPDDAGDGRKLARRLIEEHAPVLATLPTDTGNCSYLRYQWSQFLFKADYCYKSGMPQWLEQLHHLCGPFQPEKLLIGRHRFAHFRVWFRRQLAPYLREMLLDTRTASRPYFNRSFVEQMLRQHISGKRNYTNEIEQVLTLELTCRQFIDN